MKKRRIFTLKQFNIFLKNEKAVIGLPMRLTVSLIIGAAALSIILFYILNPCLFPGKMIVSVDPMINIIPTGFDEYEFEITVNVTDTQGYAINEASVMIKGLHDAVSNFTNSNGQATIKIKPRLESGVHESYLDIVVKAQCLKKFSKSRLIKVVRGS